MTKTVLITGSSRGIGRTISAHFKKLGYNVIDTHHTTWQPNSLNINLSKPESIKNQVAYVIKHNAKIDILVNNAGVSQRKDFLELTPFDLDYLWNVNVRGTMLMTQAVLGHMLPRKYGKIINIASIGGQWGGKEQVHYAASKAAIINFTQSMSKMYASKGIQCNCVSPGIIATDMVPDELRLIDGIPCGRVGTSDDVTNAVLFLADDKSDYVNGQTLNVNGGMYYG